MPSIRRSSFAWIRVSLSKAIRRLTGKTRFSMTSRSATKNFIKSFPRFIIYARHFSIRSKRAISRTCGFCTSPVHHIIKNRGHFLFEGQNITAGDTGLLQENFSAINAYLSDNDQHQLPLDGYAAIADILKDRRSALKAVCDVDKAEQNRSCGNPLLCGEKG